VQSTGEAGENRLEYSGGGRAALARAAFSARTAPRGTPFYYGTGAGTVRAITDTIPGGSGNGLVQPMKIVPTEINFASPVDPDISF
jgi:hypothetical protein